MVKIKKKFLNTVKLENFVNLIKMKMLLLLKIWPIQHLLILNYCNFIYQWMKGKLPESTIQESNVGLAKCSHIMFVATEDTCKVQY